MDVYEEVEDFLEHFGIKGMHWGQRKAKPGVKDVSLKKGTKVLTFLLEKLEIVEGRFTQLIN